MQSHLYLTILVLLVDLYFFFQAEDGIRDVAVTGVQTCALPILRPRSRKAMRVAYSASSMYGVETTIVRPRSEERRVGKECRPQGPLYHYKKHMNQLQFYLLKCLTLFHN